MADQVRVFVSHHHSPDEDAFTARLVADLEAAGADVWVDMSGITSDDFVKKISEGLAGRQWLVLVMTPAALASPWVQREVNVALNEHTAGRMLGVLPLVIQPCHDQDIPMLWRTLHHYNGTRDYLEAVTGLLRALGLSSPDGQPAFTDDTRVAVARVGERQVPTRNVADPEGVRKDTHAGMALLRRAVRFAPTLELEGSASLGKPERKYVFIGDYDEQKGRPLRDVLSNLWVGAAFDKDDDSSMRPLDVPWDAIVFEVEGLNYRTLDPKPATWKAIFRILSDRLARISPSAPEQAKMGHGLKDYLATEDEQAYWETRLDAHDISREFLWETFGLTRNCFTGTGLARARTELYDDRLAARPSLSPSSIYLVKNVPLSDLYGVKIQHLGTPAANRKLR